MEQIDLNSLSAKIRGISYALNTLAIDPDYDPPSGTALYGWALVLDEIAAELVEYERVEASPKETVSSEARTATIFQNEG